MNSFFTRGSVSLAFLVWLVAAQVQAEPPTGPLFQIQGGDPGEFQIDMISVADDPHDPSIVQQHSVPVEGGEWISLKKIKESAIAESICRVTPQDAGESYAKLTARLSAAGCFTRNTNSNGVHFFAGGRKIRRPVSFCFWR